MTPPAAGVDTDVVSAATDPRPLEPAAAAADEQLGAIDAAFDYLLHVTPVDDRTAWERFAAGGHRHDPTFTYAPLEVDVPALRARLAAVRLDAVADDDLRTLLATKHGEIGQQLDLLEARGTPAFLDHSLALSGGVDGGLLARARRVLDLAPTTLPDEGPTVPATAFAARSEAELAAYRRQDPDLVAAVELRDDVVTLMVSRHRVIVPVDRRVAAERVDALVHHEVGVHLLTWWNGSAQPLRLLANGTGRYEETQEGLGVLAEHLGGRLPPARLAELALRVVAAASVIAGERFTETFARLHDEHGAPARQAFGVATRVHRGGGLVKDAGYLRGLLRLVEHLQAGGSLDPLLLGKFALDDLGTVDALRRDGVLAGPRLRPHWLDGDGADRLEALRRHPGDPLDALLAGGAR